MGCCGSSSAVALASTQIDNTPLKSYKMREVVGKQQPSFYKARRDSDSASESESTSASSKCISESSAFDVHLHRLPEVPPTEHVKAEDIDLAMADTLSTCSYESMNCEWEPAPGQLHAPDYKAHMEHISNLEIFLDMARRFPERMETTLSYGRRDSVDSFDDDSSSGGDDSPSAVSPHSKLAL
mmetsp:Transcript_74453/g.177344  ORF Transcript_74453/g.177344 Transcript_74453/m.177344 type:complete len:183 (+) Transcript_74453:74-622(+)